MIGGSCPFCASTDIGESDGKGFCLDCEQTWVIGGKKRQRHIERQSREWWER